MKVLLLIFVLHQVIAKDEFGTSYLKDRHLCREWTCINSKLGLTDRLPPRVQYSQVLKGLLPGSWHGVVETALDGCYGNRTRRYTNSCPGQALWHCTIDQLIQNCPEANLRRNDKCSPVTSLAGFKYMISQSIYENFEGNLAYEPRPVWFMKHRGGTLSEISDRKFLTLPDAPPHSIRNPDPEFFEPSHVSSVIRRTSIDMDDDTLKKLWYFNSKCCNLPDIFSSAMLAECGFTHMMHYQRRNLPVNIVSQAPAVPSTESSRDSLQIINLPPVSEDDGSTEDPLDCCDISPFIQPSWRSECDFRMKWDEQEMLTIEKPAVTTTPMPATTTTAKPRLDVKVLPLSCNQETCVFRKLNIVSESGIVDTDAFTKLLNNLTTSNPAWAKAKARVVTKCLTRPLIYYNEDCQINKVLACTFDVLSENCPTSKKHDPCRHSSTALTEIVCQISSAKLPPRSRHQYCEVPSLVHNDILQECGITSLNRLEYSTHPVSVPNRKKQYSLNMCHKLTDSSACLLSKMGVLNKYNFMDYFKMKDRLRSFMKSHHEQQYYSDAYFSAFDAAPRYSGYCSSPKKLLNLLDAMLMTCPLSKRKSSQKCYKMFSEISQSPLQNRNLTREQVDQILNYFQQIFIPFGTRQHNVLRSTPKTVSKVPKKLYNFGILDDGNAPPVRIIDVNPTTRPIKVLLPVYKQIYGDMTIYGHNNDATLRGGVVHP